MALISVITDEKNQLTKYFKLSEDQTLVKTAPGHLYKGTIESFDVSAVQLIDLIKDLNQNQCLCLGVLAEPGRQDIFCNKTAPEKTSPIRSKEFLDFPLDSAFLLLDFDDSGKSPDEALQILAEVDPQFETCGAAVIPSSSSYIYTEDGTEIMGEGNFHIFVELHGSRNPEEYGTLLFERLQLIGHITPKVTKAGTVVMKSLFDRVVLSPEREIFSADPVCEYPLVSKRLLHAQYQEGPPLNSDTLRDIDDDERLELRILIRDMRNSVQEEANKAREKYYESMAKERAAINGTTCLQERTLLKETPIMYDKKGRPIMELLSDQSILDEDGKRILIRDLLLDPQHGVKIPDPIEPYKRGDERKGIPGKGVATILGTMIYSHHHCGIIYLLRWTAEDAIAVANGDDGEKKLFLWRALAAGKQELSSCSSDVDIAEVAEALKTNLAHNKEARIGRERRTIVNKIKVSTPPDDVEEDPILEMNAKYGIVNMGGKTVIVSERWNRASGEFDVEFSLPSSLDTLTKNKPMRIPGVSAPVSLYRYWEQHPERRTYTNVIFEPNNNTFRQAGKERVLPSTEEYNLFQGYIFNPKAATSCDLILKHIEEVWCSSIQEEYEFTVNWLAHLFQYPERLSQTALVLQSAPGAGKGIIIENCIVKVLGIHAISTSNTEDLVGRFNLHLGMNVFFYANEMAYTARNDFKSMLKTVVETDTRMVEAKNINKIKSRNYTSLIISSNNEWVLNIDFGDRRFMYLTVSSHRVRDFEYFKRLYHQIENGGKDAFIKYLLERDISGFDINAIPNKGHHQRQADFLRSAHPCIRFVWSLYDTDLGVSIYATDISYKQLKAWHTDENCQLALQKGQLFSLFVEYCEYYKIDRKYDDPNSIIMQLEIGGVLRRETDPRDEFVMFREKRNGKEVYVLKSIKEGKLLLKV